MKKTPLMLFATIVAFSLTGCKKFCDQIHNNPGQEFKYCDIKTFKVSFRETYNEFTVTYNSNGQPKDVIGQKPGAPPQNFSQDQHFRYDKKGRVTDWIINYPGLQHVVQWRTYHYVSPAKVLDTTYMNTGSIITDLHPMFNGQGSVVGRVLDFDKYGRIVKITVPAINSVQNIVYDANGNSNQYPAYDTGINVMRTNKVWMFVNLNYNVNNYVFALNENVYYSYNSNMLPTSLYFSDRIGGPFMSVFAVNSLGIDYDCGSTSKLQ